MNLSSIIHNEHRGSHSHHQQSFPPFDQHQNLRRHPNYTYEGNMASVLTPQNPYTSQPHLFAHPPHSPPSPPISDDPSAKRLPSIQSFIEMSDPSNERKFPLPYLSISGRSYFGCSGRGYGEALSASRRQSTGSRSSAADLRSTAGKQARLWH